jgi:hypothetical protein
MINYAWGIELATNNEVEALTTYQGIKLLKKHTHGNNFRRLI